MYSPYRERHVRFLRPSSLPSARESNDLILRGTKRTYAHVSNDLTIDSMLTAYLVCSYSGYLTQMPSSSVASSRPAPDPNAFGAQQRRKGRKIGMQERPLETGYYDILDVPATASTDNIKKAYRSLQTA